MSEHQEIFMECTRRVQLFQFPIRIEEYVYIADCDVFLDDLHRFWEAVSQPLSAPLITEYQMAILRCQLRSQNSGRVRLVHRFTHSRLLLLDVLLHFDAYFTPAKYVYELWDLERELASFPRVSLTGPSRGIAAQVLYDLSDVRIKVNPYAQYEPFISLQPVKYLAVEEEELIKTVYERSN